ncbi:hypothetical protein QO004_002788 [Rhizobium mesoamericanum]|nr:hypothetical protein [Rhizobium mesoamericanum]
MSNATQNLPDDPAFLKAMIAALQAENAKMSATLQAHDQLIQSLRLRIAKLKKQVFGKSSSMRSVRPCLPHLWQARPKELCAAVRGYRKRQLASAKNSILVPAALIAVVNCVLLAKT